MKIRTGIEKLGKGMILLIDLFGPKILEGDYRPGFFMKHFIKDMKLALIESNISGLDLNVLSQVLAEYEELQAEGLGDEGTQALFKLISDIFPRITEKRTSCISFTAVCVRRVLAPAPTGSRSTGCPSSFAFFPARNILSILLL